MILLIYMLLINEVALGMGIADWKLLYCHSVAEVNVDKKISTLKYNNRTVYDCFNDPFTDEFGSPALNLPPITFYDRPYPHKRARYTPDLLPADISVASENSGSTLTTSSGFPKLLLQPSDYPITPHAMNKCEP